MRRHRLKGGALPDELYERIVSWISTLLDKTRERAGGAARALESNIEMHPGLSPALPAVRAALSDAGFRSFEEFAQAIEYADADHEEPIRDLLEALEEAQEEQDPTEEDQGPEDPREGSGRLRGGITEDDFESVIQFLDVDPEDDEDLAEFIQTTIDGLEELYNDDRVGFRDIRRAIEDLTGQNTFAALITFMNGCLTWYRARSGFVTALSAYLEDDDESRTQRGSESKEEQGSQESDQSGDAVSVYGGIRRHGFARFRHLN